MAENLNPLLVVGPGRAGTSLLMACLGGHPRITARYEYRAMEILTGSAADRFIRFRAACEEDGARHPGTIWANKITTEQIAGPTPGGRLESLAVDAAEELVAAMPEYRIVFIIRDGRSCIASKQRRGHVPLAAGALRWCDGAHVLYRLRDLGALTALVRYEELVRSPQVALPALCRSLGIDFYESMLRQTDSEALAPEYRNPTFIAEKATIPPLPDDIVAIIEPELRRLGYL